MQIATERPVDVLVVGGGPAGCAAAIWAALSGLDVVLLEARQFPRPRPGESLHPGILAVLRQLGVGREVEEAGFLRYPGHIVEWGGERRYRAFGSDATTTWLGLHAVREKFDDILLRRAKALGVRVLQPCAARGLVMASARRVVGIDSTAGPIMAQFVIDAAGGGHWLGRRLGMRLYHASRRLIVYYGYASITNLAAHAVPYLTADPTGWTWIARISQRHLAWAHLPFTQTRTRPSVPVQVARHAVPIGPSRGVDVTWRMLPASAGPGYFVAGDASAVLDPLSSQGVLQAMMSGMQAAYLAGLVVHRGADEALAAKAYQESRQQTFERQASVMRTLYDRLPSRVDLSAVDRPSATESGSIANV